MLLLQIILNYKVHKVQRHLDIRLAISFIKHHVDTVCDLDVYLLRVRIVKNPFLVLNIAHCVIMAVVSTHTSMHDKPL